MTAPPLPAAARLAVVAGWDAGPVARAAATLRAAAERLPGWRSRLEGVARSLDGGESWSGPASRTAAAGARELSAVTWSVEVALVDSAGSFRRLALEVDRAGELAREALVRHDRAQGGDVAAEAALLHAAAAATAAADAGERLARLGVRDAFVPVDFASLAVRAPRATAGDAPPGPPD
ncbi:UNVERIFIED_ORG: hypothetical protein E4P37_20315, partial [Bacillus sp. AZ43]